METDKRNQGRDDAWIEGLLRRFQHLPADHGRLWALLQLCDRIPFDRAYWVISNGDTSPAPGGADGNVEICARRMAGFPAQELAQAITSDALWLRASQAEAQAQVWPLVDRTEAPPTGLPIWGLPGFQGSALCIVLDTSPLPDRHGLLVMREGGQDGFSKLDARRLERLAPFMGLACTFARTSRGHRQGATSTQVASWCWGEVDSSGDLLDADNGLAATLRSEWPRWQGPALPQDMWERIQSRSGNCGSDSGRHLQWRWSPLPRGVWLSVRRLEERTTGLSAREMEVASAYAMGRTHREIATSLALAPATVRAHLRHIFSKLSVSSKVELGRALLGATAAADDASPAGGVPVN